MWTELYFANIVPFYYINTNLYLRNMATDPELKDGFTLPVWMKTKPTKEFEPYARSPPAPEDSFFYIRYPKTEELFGTTKIEKDITKILNDQSKDLTGSMKFNAIKETEWAKRTKSYQDVLQNVTPINTAANPTNSKLKSAGDDGFKGEGTASVASIAKVAHDLISNRPPRGFTVADPGDPSADSQAPDSQHHRLMTRRGSKSLPTTPLQSPRSSPTSRKKKYSNRYFTSPFEPVEDANNRSWLTMALLGFKKDLTTSTSTLAEEEIIENRLHGSSLLESVENLGPSPRGKESKVRTEVSTHQPTLSKPGKTSQAFRPKPSELREMNFWSPTSM